jgi:hypothetical protein
MIFGQAVSLKMRVKITYLMGVNTSFIRLRKCWTKCTIAIGF